MKQKIWIAFFMLITSNNIYAVESNSIQQGAAQYDWQTCVDTAAARCINNCSTSEERDCNDNCQELAKDKCQSEGLTPPQ